LSGRGLCVGLITHPEESYRMWCVWVSLRELNNEEALAQWGGRTTKNYVNWMRYFYKHLCNVSEAGDL